MTKGEIDTEEYEFEIGKKIKLEQEILLQFEIRYKQELKTVGVKI